MIDPQHTSTNHPPGYSQVSKRPSLLSRIMGTRRSPSPAGSAHEEHESLPPLAELTLLAPGSTHSRLLDSELAANIRSLIPPRIRLYHEWELVYALDRDGISLNTLYHQCDPDFQHHELNKKRAKLLAEKGFAEDVVKKMVEQDRMRPITFSSDLNGGHRPHGYVLIIQDEKKNKFGCYLNEHLRAMDHKRYYGNGECFLWKCEWYDESKRTGGPTQRKQRFKVFMYTGMNENMIYSNHDHIAIGSSHGQNGLWIDSSLYLGVSYPCETFGNEILNQADEGQKYGKFKIMGLELWRVGALD